MTNSIATECVKTITRREMVFSNVMGMDKERVPQRRCSPAGLLVIVD